MTLHRATERALIARLTIGLIRILRMGKLGKTGSVTGEIENLLISGIVLLGEVEGRTRTASDIARMLNIPRATAIRKLGDLVERGVIFRRGTHYLMNEENIAGNDAYI